MEYIWQLLLFSFACSMDGLGVGLSYGMRKIIITKVSMLVIFITTVTIVFVSMTFGSAFSAFFSPQIAKIIGASILILIGCWISIQSLLNINPKEENQKEIMIFKIKPLGIVIHILREPVKADFDESGIITSKEALILGLALSLDSFSAGFGVGVAGYSIKFLPLVVGFFQLLALYMGTKLANSSFLARLNSKAAIIPGLILIFLGIVRL